MAIQNILDYIHLGGDAPLKLWAGATRFVPFIQKICYGHWNEVIDEGYNISNQSFGSILAYFEKINKFSRGCIVCENSSS